METKYIQKKTTVSSMKKRTSKYRIVINTYLLDFYALVDRSHNTYSVKKYHPVKA
jgi:hypothetical protein